MSCPSLIRAVASRVPTTADSPSSRATMAAWLVRPPLLVTMTAAFLSTAFQSGLVMSVTRISPGCRRCPSAGESMRRATPVTIWLPTALPVASTGPVSVRWYSCRRRSWRPW